MESLNDVLDLPSVLRELIWDYLTLIHRDFLVAGDLRLVIRYKKEFDTTFVTEVCQTYGININACHPLKAKGVSIDGIPFIHRYERYMIKYKHYIRFPLVLYGMSNITTMYYAILYNDLTLLANIPDTAFKYCDLRHVTVEALDVMYARSNDKPKFCIKVIELTRHFKWAQERLKKLHLPVPFLSLYTLGYSKNPRSLFRFASHNTFEDFLQAHKLFPNASLRGITRVAATNNDVPWFDYLLKFDPELNPDHPEWETTTDVCDRKKHLQCCLSWASKYTMRKRICDLLQIKYQPTEKDVVYYDNIFWFRRSISCHPAMIVFSKSHALKELLFQQGKQYLFRDWMHIPQRRSRRIEERNQRMRNEEARIKRLKTR